MVLSAFLGWKLAWCVALIGIPTIAYTVVGGVQAVTWADVKQMVVISGTIALIVAVLWWRLPVPLDDALRVAGSTGRLRAFDPSLTLTETYTVWSGLVGGTFLMLSYFGTDQSQVQRYLAARSVDEARTSLLLSAYWKIPLQALILLMGVLVYLFYVFTPAPLLHNPRHEAAVRAERPLLYDDLKTRHDAAWQQRAGSALALRQAHDDPALRREWAAAMAGDQQIVDGVRAEALAAAAEVTGEPSRDVNYVMPRFVLEQLPLGFAGLFLAAVLAAAMSSIAAELNALATATVVDFYQRWVRPAAPDAHYLAVSKGATAAWGAVACVVATFAATLGSLIEVVNRFGSFFYGSILGVFLLAMVPGARARGAFTGLLAGMGVVAAVSFGAPQVSFLWHNVIGAVVVLGVGALEAALSRRAP